MNERSIFMEALEKDTPARRSAYLEGACGGDAVLRQRVEALLASHEQAGSFLGKPVAERLAEKRATPERAEESPAEPPGGAGHDQPLTPGLPATLDEPAVTKRPGTIIGPYKLLQQLGEGGMGTVYMAEQTHPVQRKVALKVIKAGMDGRQIIARFEVERQALAMMDHVNIARVLDAGATQSGRPYFVMELVHGVPITKYCDDNHLTPRQRLELFVPVCQAIQHAHQKGIIHRDIKPSNVMITLYEGKPVPKVIDFGVAKATEQKLTERTLFTQYGTMVGTLEYMSPEQAEMSALGADTRSDIFSLGVLLYELLTGGTPLSHKRLKEAAYGEILRMIREEEAPRPSARLSESGEALASISAHRHMEPAKLTKLVRGELDWIVMKCLEKDRNRRYETANGFAMDVQRYLNDETVQACPPSGWYRFRKFARRNKAALVMASVVGVAVLLLLAVLAVGIVLVNREKEFVKDERDQKDQALQLADANLIQAHESVNRYLTIVSEDTLLDAPGLQPLRKQLLEAALKYYQSFLQQRSHDPELQADVAMTYLRVAVIYNSLGEYDEATLALITGLETVDRLVREHPGDTELSKRFAGYFTTRRPFHTTGRAMKTDPRRVLQALQRSAELWEGFARENPNIPGFRSDLLATYMLLGGLLAGSNQDEAFRTYRKASETAEKLVHENPAVPSHQERLAQIYYDVAGALKGLGRTQEAETTYRQAVECFEKSAAEFPGEPEFRANLGISLKHLANFFAVYKRDKEAEDTFRRSVALLDKAVNDFPDKVDYRDALSVSYEGLANFLARDSGRVQEAEKVLRQALTLQEKLAADFPHVPNYRRALASSYGTLSDVLKKDRPKEAVQALRQKLTVREKLMIDYPTIERYRGELLETQEQLINLLLYTGQSLEVEKLYRQAIVRFEKLAAANPSVPEYRRELAWNHNRLGILLRNAGRAPEAENELRKAIDLYEKLLVDFPAVLAYRTRLVDLLNKTGKGKDVERVDREAISRLEKLAAAHPKSSRLTQELAQLLRSVGRMPETLALWEKLVAEYPGNDYYRLQLANSHNDLGTMLKAAGRHAEAEQAYRQALALKEKLVADSPANPDYRFHLAHSCLGLAYLFSDTKRRQEAERFYSQALALFEKLSDDVPSQDNYRMEVGHVLWQLADLSSTAGHHAEAEKILRRSLGVFEKLAADFPKIPYYRVEQGFTHWKLGWLMNSLSRPREAEEPFRQAMAVYKKLAADYPQNQDYRLRLAQSYNYLAEVLVRQGKHAECAGQWDNAAAEYTKAIELKPDAWEAWSGRAFVHFNRQQWDTAISDFSKAIDLAPQVHTNWWHRGHAYLQLAQWAKAAANFGKVVAQWPDGSEGWYLRSVAFAQLHQPDEALADLRQAIAKGFNNVEQMKTDPKLAPLRTREDFRKLLEVLERKEKSQSKQSGR